MLLSACSLLLEQLQKRHGAATRALRASTRFGRERLSYAEQVISEAVVSNQVENVEHKPFVPPLEKLVGLPPTSAALPSTDELLDAAIAARDVGWSYDPDDGPVLALGTRVRVGAALLTQSGKVFTACAVPSISHGNEVSGPYGSSPVLVSAEQACLLNALSHGEHDVRAMFLVSNSADDFVMPTASSAADMAAHGDFPVFIAKADRTMTRYMTSELAAAAILEFDGAVSSGPLRIPGESEDSSEAEQDNVSPPSLAPTIDWTTTDVSSWLKNVVHLPKYIPSFMSASVDGALLLSLSENDIQDNLDVFHPLHRRKIVQAINGLRAAGTFFAACL